MSSWRGGLFLTNLGSLMELSCRLQATDGIRGKCSVIAWGYNLEDRVNRSIRLIKLFFDDNWLIVATLLLKVLMKPKGSILAKYVSQFKELQRTYRDAVHLAVAMIANSG